MAVWTILVMACLSWPCFLDRTRTWSFSNVQFPAFLQMVHIAIRVRDVDARSEACGCMNVNVNIFSRMSSGLGARDKSYLSGLLLEDSELLDSGLDVGL